MEKSHSSSYQRKKVSINIVTIRGGGAHYATYNALSSIIEQKQLPWHLTMTDVDAIVERLVEQKRVVDVYSKLFGASAYDLYNKHVLKSGWTWFQPLMMHLNKVLIKLNHDVGVKIFEEYWREQQPDMVVSVASSYNKGLWDSVQRAKPGTPVVSILTDFADCPPAFWIEPQTGNYLVCATEKAVDQARSMGVKEELIIQSSGIVIHPRFYEPIAADRRIERQSLGLDPDCLTGLVLFGGYGSNIMLEIAQNLECFGQKLQLIFICGRNEELAEALRNSQSLQKRVVTNFTQEIPYYMHLADFFIGKPGACSISEALAMKLPVIVERNWKTIINERYNTKWIQQKQVGIVIPSFQNIQKAVEQFLEPEKFARYRANVARLNNRSVFEIPDILQQILAKSYQTKMAEPLEQR
jgi:1,2-diacylglycerol 3-beta-galactosyltransferase